MHIIAILTSIAVLIYWVGRAAGGFDKIFGAGQAVRNAPRKYRYVKAANKRGYDLVESPLEAACVLMIATARLSDNKRIGPAEESEIKSQLEDNMHLSVDDADGLFTQMEALVHDIVLPESAIFPMVDILRKTIERDHAKELAQMMEAVASVDGVVSDQQKDFIRRYRERMNLLH